MLLSRCPIRYKLLIGVALLLLLVAALSVGGLMSVSSYRNLVRGVSQRSAELPLAGELGRSVNDLRVTFGEIRSTQDIGDQTKYAMWQTRERFSIDLVWVKDALRRYREQLEILEPNGRGIIDNRDEWETVRKIERTLESIEVLNNEEDWVLETVQIDTLGYELETLHQLVKDLPSYLQTRMQDLKGSARGQYHTLIALTSTTSVLALVILLLLVKFFYDWVFRPMRILVRGSRRVASGDFNHRIHLSTQDEMAELANALNAMTIRFQQIRDGLDREVKERTQEVVRSEQLASVGFLAAGVAHEINNPLASIAWCAEAIESRLEDLVQVPGENEETVEAEADEDRVVVLNYLRRIQDEAFRCKGITEGLLDFSRMGDVEKHDTELSEVIRDVIDMVRHLGRYRQKNIEFETSGYVVARVNSQEIKQVVLNLVTNALDSLEEGGLVKLKLNKQEQNADLTVTDDGCGMSAEVLEHLFEPFFTRRRDGQGTGLGLSITYRIVSEHGGKIQAASDGPGHGSRFRVTLPLVQDDERNENQDQAA